MLTPSFMLSQTVTSLPYFFRNFPSSSAGRARTESGAMQTYSSATGSSASKITAVVLILQYTHEQHAVRIREVAPQILRNSLRALRVVPAVNDEARLIVHKLEAPRPAHGVQSVLHIALVERPAAAAQHLDKLQHDRGVAQLGLPPAAAARRPRRDR